MKPPRFLLNELALVGLSAISAAAAPPVFNIRDHGAAGDGKALDTAAINKAIDACSTSGGGQVLVPPGKYLTGTVQLKSNVTLCLDAGSEIVGTSDLDQYHNFNPPNSTPLADRNRWHRALVLGVNVENVTITGRGIINGNKVFDARGEERMRGPHAILFGNSKNITLRDFSIKDAANYAVMLEFTSQVTANSLTITGGWDGIHFRGWKDNPCRDVTITNCQFYTGDDCIAGWFWENTLISNCIINSSCNGIRLIGPAKNLIIHDCLFFGPGRFEHRTSRDRHRTNMLAALCLQPGAWDRTDGPLDDVRISNITTHNVTTPLHLSVKSPNTAGTISVDRLTATGSYFTAASIESWSDSAIQRVMLRDVSLEFTGGGTAQQAAITVKSPPVDARALPCWGLYARNVKTLDLQNVRMTLTRDDARPAMICENVANLGLDHFRIPAGPLVLNRVQDLQLTDTPLPLARARCTDLKFASNPLSASAIVEDGAVGGLTKLELVLPTKSLTRWIYLRPGQPLEVPFTDLPTLPPGKHPVRCGQITRELIVE